MPEIVIKQELTSETLTAIREIIQEVVSKSQTAQLQEKFLSSAETCKLFQPAISKPTLTAWARDGRLTEHRIGGRVFFKYSEVIEAVSKIKRFKK